MHKKKIRSNERVTFSKAVQIYRVAGMQNVVGWAAPFLD